MVLLKGETPQAFEGLPPPQQPTCLVQVPAVIEEVMDGLQVEALFHLSIGTGSKVDEGNSNEQEEQEGLPFGLSLRGHTSVGKPLSESLSQLAVLPQLCPSRLGEGGEKRPCFGKTPKEKCSGHGVNSFFLAADLRHCLPSNLPVIPGRETSTSKPEI